MAAFRYALALLIVLLSTSVAAPSALSDSLILASDPQPKAELAARPGWVTLVFRRDVDVSVAKILVLTSGGDNVTVGPLIVEGTNVTTQLSSQLKKDTYTVLYRIDRPDGQPQGGAFQFAYGRGNWTSVPASSWSGQSAEPSVLSNPNPKATSAAPSPTEVATESPTPSLSKSPTTSEIPPASPLPSAGPGTTSPTLNDSPIPWLLGGVVLAVIIASVWLVARRKRA